VVLTHAASQFDFDRVEWQIIHWVRFWHLCPDAPPGPVVSPTVVARSFFETMSFDPPAPEIKPGDMLVGWESFLETHAVMTQQLNTPTPFGQLVVDARSQLFVDWGDGTPETGPYDDPGGPYPNGHIRHVYESGGQYDITVRQVWTATFSLGGGAPQAVPGTLEITGTLQDFPVHEVQAESR
jgi:hypothetical protein